MIILIDTSEKVIEVEGVETEEDTKKILKETLKNFKDYEHIVVPPVKINFIPIDNTINVQDFVNKLFNNSFDLEKINDVKPGPPQT
jgi:hypothetical protein